MADESSAALGEHVVRFYETDDFLVGVLRDFVRDALAVDDACIVVASPTRRDPLERRLADDGLDVDAAQASGAYIWVDAVDMLAHVMLDGSPDAARFEQVVGGAIERAAARHGSAELAGRRYVHVFGEMVALLWAEGNPAAALRLEALWNELQRAGTTSPFALACAYPMRGFVGHQHEAGFIQVCRQHSHVIPVESYSTLVDTDARLRAITLLQQKAASLEAEIGERKRLQERARQAFEALLAMAETLVQSGEQPEQTGQPDGAANAARRASSTPAPTSTRNRQPQVAAPATAATAETATGAPPPQGASNTIAMQLLRLLRTVLGSQVLGIAALHPETEGLQPIGVLGLSSEAEQQWCQGVSRSTIRSVIGDPATYDRLRANEVVYLGHGHGNGRARPAYALQCSLVVPICMRDHLIGLLSVEHPDAAHSYTADELALVRAAAKLAAVVLERERLLRDRETARARVLALEEATQRMDEFLGIASHELRTPLTTLLASVQMSARQLDSIVSAPLVQVDAAQGAVDATTWSEPRITDAAELDDRDKLARARQLLTRAERQTRRLGRLVGDLVDISRIDAGKLDLLLERCDLTEIVHDVVQGQRATAPGRCIELVTPPTEEAVPILADADRIGQVLTNYLTNALKYSERDESIVVEVCVTRDTGWVGVRDRGPGLAPDECEHIWERFHRAENISVRSGSGVGLGLGLFISRTIVERHNGHVGVESEPGRGSTFWFTLPLAKER